MHRLHIDVASWSVLSTAPLDRALGLPESPSPGASLAYHLFPRCDPSELPQPLSISVAGKQPASMMARRRGAGPGSSIDLLVSPGLAVLLSEFELPPHVPISCEAEVRSLDGRPTKSARHPFTWLWWQEPFGEVDFSASTFIRHDQSGVAEQLSFECFEDYEFVRRRSLRGDFVLVPESLSTPPRERALDLVPDSLEGCAVSARLHARLGAAKLPGIRVAAP